MSGPMTLSRIEPRTDALPDPVIIDEFTREALMLRVDRGSTPPMW